jgi:hypothetical protein
MQGIQDVILLTQAHARHTHTLERDTPRAALPQARFPILLSDDATDAC